MTMISDRLQDRRALDLRYDGPIPRDAAVPRDAGEPWAVQLRNRERLAWLDVLRIGKQLASARREFRRSYSVPDLRRSQALERDVIRARDIWRDYRDWARAEAGEALAGAAE